MFEMHGTHVSGMLTFAVSYATLAMIPGPNTLIVARASLAGSRFAALATAAGVAVGASLLALLAAGSCAALFADTGFRVVASVVFAIMLSLVGVRLVAGSLHSDGATMVPTGRNPHFGLGFLTALTNPVSAVFFGSASVRLGEGLGGGSAETIAVTVFLVAACWFGLVAIGVAALSSNSLYLRCRRPFALFAGLLLIWQAFSTVAGTLPA